MAKSPSSASTPSLALRGITKRFAGVAALTDVDLEIQSGEIHALLGENGAGKSTLMNVASGVYQPDEGELSFRGESIQSLNPKMASRLGIAIVHQHPAVLPDLTVEENLRAALPSALFQPRSRSREIAQGIIDSVKLDVDLRDRVENLSVSQTHLLEIAKAFALKPSVLILDEPTAPLDKDASDLLFDLVRGVVADGTSVIYITHRLAEVRQIADRVTVLRDGKVRGVSRVADISDDELLKLIIGRELQSTFPPKAGKNAGDVNIVVKNLTGRGFRDVSFEARRGEIIGVAGVVGNGQTDFMQHLAGHGSFEGSLTVNGEAVTRSHLLKDAAYLPADRLHEGLAMSLSVRENAAVAALKKFATLGFVRPKKERTSVVQQLNELAVKAPSADANVSALSGGNQQKVVMARALLSEPRIVVADEPTQGVDVGARSEIYRLLRQISDSGVPVIVNSSDAKELEGLCDRIIVMSRGHVVKTLSGSDISEAAIITSAVTATTESVTVLQERDSRVGSRWGRFLAGDYAPSALLAAVMVLLGAYIVIQNSNYLNAFNINSILGLVTALGFIGLGQTIALLTGGIDLSVGPLAGLAVVVASFFINDDSPGWMIGVGFFLMLAISLLTGLINGGLIRYAKFTAIAATLTMYIALQGVSFLLRDAPEGYINRSIMDLIASKVGPVPVLFIVLVAVTLGLEYFLRRRRWGWNLRAVGSNEEAARRIGVNVNRTVVLGYLGTSFFAFLGAVVLLAQLGVGDPSQGVGYTLSSITAVVLGGTSLLGGRGSFIGTVLGSVLLVQVMNAVVFLNLTQMWTYYFQGILILVAAVVYTVIRSRQKRKARSFA